MSTFVPKPFTPFQWHPMEKIEVVKDTESKQLKRLLLPIKGIRVFDDVPKYAYMQGLFLWATGGFQRFGKPCLKSMTGERPALIQA